jgi:O-methyltransferase domain
MTANDVLGALGEPLAADSANHEAVAPEVILHQMITSFIISSSFMHVGEFGVADLLTNGPRSVDDRAHETQLNPDALYRVMRMLAASGVFSEMSPRIFRQTPTSGALRSFGQRRVLLELPTVLQTGRTGFELAFGLSIWEYLDRHPAESEFLNRAMAALVHDVSAAITRTYDWSDVDHVLDLGGGTGTLLSAYNPGPAPQSNPQSLDRTGRSVL